MEKFAYVFNCDGDFDLLDAPGIYRGVRALTGMDCNKYGCVFREKSEKKWPIKSWSRSGVAKNFEKNVQKYVMLPKYPESVLSMLEMYDLPEGSKYFEITKRKYNFTVHKGFTKGTFFYVVLPHSLEKGKVCALWNLISEKYALNYMVSFALDSSKYMEFFMMGHPMMPDREGILTEKDFFTEAEIKMVNKLSDMNLRPTNDLGDAFPLCVTAGSFCVNETAYKVKTSIPEGVTMYER
jgi:hypothetical protein